MDQPVDDAFREASDLLARVKQHMSSLNQEQRLELLNELFDGYCKLCGCSEPCFCSPHFDI